MPFCIHMINLARTPMCSCVPVLLSTTDLRHTYTLRRDDLRALAWGKRFLGQKPHLFGPLLAALDGKTSLCFARWRCSLVWFKFKLERFI